MSKNIFRTKSINQFLSETKQDGGMNRVLGTFGLTMLGIGCIGGTGIFVLTGIAAANFSGPALVISFVTAALACGCAALCYSEFAAMIPVAGSAYTYEDAGPQFLISRYRIVHPGRPRSYRRRR